jgi:hypothetical protein
LPSGIAAPANKRLTDPKRLRPTIINPTIDKKKAQLAVVAKNSLASLLTCNSKLSKEEFCSIINISY